MSLCDMSSRQACTNPKHRTSTPVLDPFLRRDFLFLQKPGGFDALMLTMKASSLENIVARCTNHYKTHTHILKTSPAIFPMYTQLAFQVAVPLKDQRRPKRAATCFRGRKNILTSDQGRTTRRHAYFVRGRRPLGVSRAPGSPPPAF